MNPNVPPSQPVWRPSREEVAGWQPIETAPKDGTYVLALTSGATDQWEHLNGRCFVIRHEGKTPSGYDLGWSVYPGFGGVIDRWFSHWMPLPETSLSLTEAGG